MNPGRLFKASSRKMKKLCSEFIHTRRELFTKDNGKEVCDMDKELCYGRIKQGTKGSGNLTMQVASGNSSMLMVISTRDSGLITSVMGKEFIQMLMEHAMKANGKVTNSMGKVLKLGQKEPNMKVATI
jgi:hypothetical protein